MHLSKSKPTLLPIMDKGRLNNCIKNICLRKKTKLLRSNTLYQVFLLEITFLIYNVSF